MMFRRRHHNQSLPSTTSATPRSFTLRPGKGDGSARSIRLKNKSIPELWKEASVPTRITYVCLFSFLLSLYLGIRFIRYYNSHVHLDCHSTDCRLSILPIGWGKRVVVDMPRRQLLQSFSVKTDADGNFIMANPPMEDEDIIKNKYKKPGKHGYSPKSSGHYKGPDKEGNYYSYALVFREKPQDGSAAEQEERSRAEGVSDRELVDLSPLDPYTVVQDHGRRRLVMRLFRIGQSRRRVRTMITRIDSYIKRRRVRLIVKENGVPSWQGILMVVLGLVGFLLTLLIGQFWDEPPRTSTGPGVRRQQQHQPTPYRSVEEKRGSAYQRTTSARYEVRTKPAAQNRFK